MPVADGNTIVQRYAGGSFKRVPRKVDGRPVIGIGKIVHPRSDSPTVMRFETDMRIEDCVCLEQIGGSDRAVPVCGAIISAVQPDHGVETVRDRDPVSTVKYGGPMRRIGE